ncbi:T9SS type A sorting domain-containing protein [Fluviicola sp.]|uniref:T9SS type A sorting domain-containing protein n=1 Tax=Fluviicola sp. TaxID=1917219 RepID=UPI0031E0A7BA
MKNLLLSISLLLGINSALNAQCSVQVNDSLLSNYDYVLNAVNPTGTAPFTYNWTVTNGVGMPIQVTYNMGGDSLTIDAFTLQNSYGCIIYQLCMTDANGCTTCTGDTSISQIPYPCPSAFTSSIVGPNQVSIDHMFAMPMPQFMILNQFLTWTDGNGQTQTMPFTGPTVIDYTPGPSNNSNKFFCCVMTTTMNGGCISCDSIQYTNSGLGLETFGNNGLSLSPNPASSVVKIEGSSPIETVLLYNAQGQKITVNYVLNGNTAQLNIAELPKGIYTVEVTNASGTFKDRLIRE